MLKGASFIDDWIEEGEERGMQRGRVATIRESIIDLIRERFDPTVRQIEQLVRDLEKIESLPALKTLFNHAIRDQALDEFLARLI